MNNLINVKRMQLLSYVMLGMFFFVHVAMLFIFLSYGVMPLFYFNIGSAVFYALSMLLIWKKKFATAVFLSFCEIVAYMVTAIIITGWDGGFQITLIGICILLAYAEYAGRSLKLPYVKALYLAPLAMAGYIGSYIVSVNFAAPYPLPLELKNFFQISWAVVVFVIMLAVMQIFIYISTKSQELLSEEALHDELTGLPNRFDIANKLAKLPSDDRKKDYWIAILDLDDFKAINDTYGHNCGDHALVSVANIIKGLPEGIEVCRYGGEEFLLISKDEFAPAEETLEALRSKIESAELEFEGNKIKITSTIGAAYPSKEQSVDSWINAADKMLYEGKAGTKNCVLVHRPKFQNE